MTTEADNIFTAFAAPRLLACLKDFVDIIEARGLIDDSYCSGCDRHAPKDSSPTDHTDVWLTGPVPHKEDCPFNRARQLLAELTAGGEKPG